MDCRAKTARACGGAMRTILRRVTVILLVSAMVTGVVFGSAAQPEPPQPDVATEAGLRERVKAKMGWTVTIGRVANITRPLNGRAPCHYCGPCYWGCVTNSYFNSAFTTVADALASGNCTHVPNAMVYKVLTDASNRATGLLYIDRVTREAKEIRGKTVVLCAQALESARILLNSKKERNPAGLGNSSGVLGHYLMDHLWVAGGAGADIFHTFGDNGIDRVTDFSRLQGDRVMLDPGTTYTTAQVGSDVVITMNGGGQMVLVNVQLSSLTGDWIFTG